MTEWILSSSILILAVILVRRIFRDKLQPHIRYLLWALVLVRLLVPFSFFQSPVSTGGVLSEAQKLPPVQSVTDSLSRPNISYEDAYDQAVEDFQQAGQEIQQTIPDFTAPNYTPVTPLEQHTQEILDHSTIVFWLENILLWVWIGGMAVMALCLLLSNLKFRRYLRTHRQLLEKHPAGLSVYVCPGLDTPCLFGAVKPAIYLLPAEAEDETRMQHILTHELTHYRHGDHIWAALRCLCLIIHWYNPLVWQAAVLSRRDGELACDEATIRKLGEDQRIAYGVTLIEMTCAKQAGAGLMNTATTMTGSKSAIKERVTMIAKKPKKSVVALIAAAVLVVIAAVICFSTAQQANVPQMSSDQQASILEAWSGQREYLNFEAPENFSNLFYKRDGIRYYGSYEIGNYEDQTDQYSILFVPCLDSDSPTQLDINGAVFTHRSPFSLYIYSTLEIAGKIFPYFEPAPLMNVPQDALDRAAEIHATYERMLYGSVLKNVTVPNDPTGLKEAESTWLAYTGSQMDMTDTKNDYFLGRHDGYLTVFFHSGTRPQAVSSIQIGNRTFWCNCGFNMIGIKDGAIHQLEDLYEQGLISLESINKIADAHYAAYPGCYYIQPEETGGISFIDRPVHSESEGWRQLTVDELQQAKDFLSPSASMKKADPLSDSIRRLLISPFGSPEAVDLPTLVYDLPSAEPLTDEKELQALLKHPDLPSPNPSLFLKVSQTDVDQALNRFLGITSTQPTHFGIVSWENCSIWKITGLFTLRLPKSLALAHSAQTMDTQMATLPCSTTKPETTCAIF